MIRPCVTTEIKGQPVSINWQQGYMQVDAREGDQLVTTCFLRQLHGPRVLFTGTVVCSPADVMTCDFDQGQRLALARAVKAFIDTSWHFQNDPFAGPHEAWDIARKLYYELFRKPEPQIMPIEIKAMALAA